MTLSIQSLDELTAAGCLPADVAADVMQREGIDVRTLMRRLLSIAAERARSPVSHFRVGAVVQATSDDGPGAMYLGANFEFAGLALGATVHAEQAAVNNAWLHGESGIRSLAVTAPPCGHCRQFLQELPDAGDLDVLVFADASQPNDSPTKSSLAELLPAAFGPGELGVRERLLQPVARQIVVKSPDPLASLAAEAAAASYAPYTGNLAGVALTMSDGETICGRIAENAAYNPTLSPLASAISVLAMRSSGGSLDLVEAVLVEVPTKVSQRKTAGAMLRSVASELGLRYRSGRLA